MTSNASETTAKSSRSLMQNGDFFRGAKASRLRLKQMKRSFHAAKQLYFEPRIVTHF